jgi:hypothetical protein
LDSKVLKGYLVLQVFRVLRGFKVNKVQVEHKEKLEHRVHKVPLDLKVLRVLKVLIQEHRVE